MTRVIFQAPSLVLPEMNELPFANALRVLMPRLVKTMNTHFDRAIALHGIHLERPCKEFPGHLAADILPYAIRQICFAQGHATLVVTKLHIVRHE